MFFASLSSCSSRCLRSKASIRSRSNFDVGEGGTLGDEDRPDARNVSSRRSLSSLWVGETGALGGDGLPKLNSRRFVSSLLVVGDAGILGEVGAWLPLNLRIAVPMLPEERLE